MIVKDSNDLLNFLVAQSDSSKNWFGFQQQKITAIVLAHEIASRHANTMTPNEVVEYARELNNLLYLKMIKPST